MVKRKLSHLRVNSVVKAFIYAEMFLWSGWNFIMPIFSIFVAKLPNGSVEKAASAFSFYLISRVVFSLMSGRYLTGKKNRHKFFLTMLGMSLLSFCYLGLAFVRDITQIYFFYIMTGLAIGIATPAKNSLFSANMKKEKATATWGALDAGVMLSMAITGILGGKIAGEYGFHLLFFLAAGVNTLALLPYILYINFWRKKINYSPIQSFGYSPLRKIFFK